MARRDPKNTSDIQKVSPRTKNVFLKSNAKREDCAHRKQLDTQ